MRDSGAISVTAVIGEGEAPLAESTATGTKRRKRKAWRSYALSVLAVALTVAIAWGFNAVMAHAVGSIAMLFLVPVLLSAVSFGLRPALVTAFLSVWPTISSSCRRSTPSR